MNFILSGRLPEDFIDEVRANNDIVNVVSEYVRLERKGKDYFGLCPFHKEKSPSFSVVPGKQIFYCFGCAKGGDVISFIMQVENLDYLQATRLLAERARLPIPEGESEEEKKQSHLREELLKLNKDAAKFFYMQLMKEESQNARAYVKGRNISIDTIKKFGLGYSPENWDDLFRYIKSMGYSEFLIEKSGLFLKKKAGGFVDRFRNRIMFPIFDLRGNVIAFGGRAIKSGDSPKYMNSPETPVYSKSRNLYALNIAKNSGKNNIIVVEGYMDVISLHQSGIINTVASLGTALTESQARLLKKYAEDVIISYDADTAGQAATVRGLGILSEAGCNVKVLTVPEGKDPDEFIKNKGRDAFQRLIDNAITLVEYKIRLLKKEISTDNVEGRISFLNKISQLLAQIDSSVEREVYIRKISKEYDISEESLFQEVYKKINKNNTPKKGTNPGSFTAANKIKETDKKPDIKNSYLESLLLALLATDNSVYRKNKGIISLNLFEDQGIKDIAESFFARLEEGKDVSPADLIGSFGENSGEFARIIREECNCDDNTKAVLDIIKKIEQSQLEKRQQKILDLLSNKSEIPEGDVEKLKQELQTIIIKMRNL